MLDDDLVTNYRTKDIINITIHGFNPARLVPSYEENMVRINAGYTIPSWGELTHMEKATEVAVKRISGAIEAQVNEAVNKKSK